MKQYFTGFFTALCLTSSIFIFMGSKNRNLGDITVSSISIHPGKYGGGYIKTYNDNERALDEMYKDVSRIETVLFNNSHGGSTPYFFESMPTIEHNIDTDLDNVYMVGDVTHTISAGEYSTSLSLFLPQIGTTKQIKSKLISAIESIDPEKLKENLSKATD